MGKLCGRAGRARGHGSMARGRSTLTRAGRAVPWAGRGITQTGTEQGPGPRVDTLLRLGRASCELQWAMVAPCARGYADGRSRAGEAAGEEVQGLRALTTGARKAKFSPAGTACGHRLERKGPGKVARVDSGRGWGGPPWITK